jgi:DedD protein
MRDVHRMKEKWDVSLDNRQVVSFLITVIVILGAVFVLGVVVGKKLASTEPATAAPDLLTALDQKAAALEAAKQEPPLTFQEELTKKTLDPLPVTPPVLEAPTVPSRPSVDAAVPTRTVKEVLKETPPAPKTPETTANGKFTLQLAASQSKPEADRFVARLRDKGYAPFIVEAQVPGKGTWYRVRVGSFGTKEAAQQYLQDFRRETQVEGFVTAAP